MAATAADELAAVPQFDELLLVPPDAATVTVELLPPALPLLAAAAAAAAAAAIFDARELLVPVPVKAPLSLFEFVAVLELAFRSFRARLCNIKLGSATTQSRKCFLFVCFFFL